MDPKDIAPFPDPEPEQSGFLSNILSLMNSFMKGSKDALWWGMVGIGCYVAIQQGWLTPFSQPPGGRRHQHAGMRENQAEQDEAVLNAEEQPAAHDDPVTTVSVYSLSDDFPSTLMHACMTRKE